MTDEQSRETLGALTDVQRSRIDFARRDLDYARSEDLAQLPTAGHILMIERLRTRLDDILQLIDEVAGE
ncbi:hypothetical protein [Streptomyces cahuitamycinicus]|uniref:Uncharacterized protein n=1 Tax=Streptomyces cahuitamycinicus TaxID=2070367 RepID=A0A2N8TMS5_9ACTN|nr:hypothetical protein [Streptomyces cahuitamycinicus]PNG20315.1 hypothetical protein C1J00_20850 [Streptomyces cahuitamycinicus]